MSIICHELHDIGVFMGTDSEGTHHVLLRPAWRACDHSREPNEPLFLILAPTGTSRDTCEAYARRCVELLDRYGLTDIPDDLGSEVSDA